MLIDAAAPAAAVPAKPEPRERGQNDLGPDRHKDRADGGINRDDTSRQKGDRGSDGLVGDRGADGANGGIGERGFNGSDGGRGADGPKGDRGVDGANGGMGKQGESGPEVCTIFRLYKHTHRHQ